jgi:cell division protein FtsB
LIYGTVQQQRRAETKGQLEECKQQVDSLKAEVEKLNQHVGITLKQLQVERDAAISANNSNRKQ